MTLRKTTGFISSLVNGRQSKAFPVLLVLVAAFAVLFACASTVPALAQDLIGASYTFTSFKPPGSPFFPVAAGIDNAGEVVGSYYGNPLGYTRSASGAFAEINDAGLQTTTVSGINYKGTTIVGYGCVKTATGISPLTGIRGGCGSTPIASFLLRNGQFTSYQFPGANTTAIHAVNDNGLFVGLAAPGGAFVSNGTTHTTIAGATLVAINNKGIIVGYDGTAVYEFNTSGKKLGEIAVPGMAPTSGLGINNLGVVVGAFHNSTGTHCFIWQKGEYSQLDVPEAKETLACNGINDKGQIVGTYEDQSGEHSGFIATP
jgi:hypothetical protein